MKVDLPEIYNAATTFVDENIAQGRGKKVAIYSGDRQFTYQEVFEQVNRLKKQLDATLKGQPVSATAGWDEPKAPVGNPEAVPA